MKLKILLVAWLVPVMVHSQELFSLTEPASNKPAGSLTCRVDNSMMNEINTSRINYHLIPELMAGISKKLMINAAVFFSNRTNVFRTEGGSLYAKYRFLSKDGIQTHFRAAVFGRFSYNNSDIHQEEISLYGHNTGAAFGVVATQLLKKVALSTSFMFSKATDNGNNNKFVYGTAQRNAITGTFSAGKLMLPKSYSSYQQTNVNLMVELLTQFNCGSGKYYIDIAPVLQVIVNSQSRVDIGYRKEIKSDLLRTAPNGWFVRLEYNFFNVL